MKLKFKLNKKRVIYILIALIAIAAIAAASLLGGAVDVSVNRIDTGRVEKIRDENGTIRGWDEVGMTTKSSGVVEALNVEEGDTVQAGDVLIQVDTADLENQINSLESEINALYATLAEALKGTDSENISQMRSQVNVAELERDTRKTFFEKSQILYDNGAISKEAFDASETALKLSEENLNIANSQLKLSRKGLSANLKEQYNSQIESLEYQLNILKNQLENSTITATTSGIATFIYVKEGDYIMPGTPLIEISSDDKKMIETNFLVSEIRDIKVGQRAVLVDDANDVEMRWESIVYKVYPKAYSKISDLGVEQKRVKVELEPTENINDIPYGAELEVRIIIDERDDVVRVPDNSVFEINNEKHVFLVKGKTIELTLIETGLKGEDYYEVVAGLKSGDLVVESPGKDLEDGGKVKYVEE